MLTFVLNSFVLQLTRPLNCISYLLVAFGRLPNQVSLLLCFFLFVCYRMRISNEQSLLVASCQSTWCLVRVYVQVVVVAMVFMLTFFHMPKLDQPIITVRPVLGVPVGMQVARCASRHDNPLSRVAFQFQQSSASFDGSHRCLGLDTGLCMGRGRHCAAVRRARRAR